MNPKLAPMAELAKSATPIKAKRVARRVLRLRDSRPVIFRPVAAVDDARLCECGILICFRYVTLEYCRRPLSKDHAMNPDLRRRTDDLCARLSQLRDSL